MVQRVYRNEIREKIIVIYLVSGDIGTANFNISLFTPTNGLLAAVTYGHSEISQNTTLFELSVDKIYANFDDKLMETEKRFGLEGFEIVLTTAMHSVQLMTADYAPINGLVNWADQG